MANQEEKENKEKRKIWDSFWQTDPATTKAFSKGGGFRGTAINPTYVKERLTTFFGPIGIGWGYSVKDEQLIPGHKDGINQVVIHKVLIEFWYKFGGAKSEPLQAFGQTTMVGQNKNGWFTDEEAPKKSLTDAWMKAVSDLGMSADIHAGLYDDNKYLAEVKQQFKKEAPAEDAVPLNLDDIPFGGVEEVPPYVTTKERNDFVAYVQSQGVTVSEVKAILNENGVATSADIPQERLGFFKSRVQDFAGKKGLKNDK